MADWPGQKSRGRGQLLSGKTRSGRGFYYGGRRVLLMDEPGTELVWAGDGVAQFTNDVLEAVFSTLAQRGLAYMQARTPVDTGELVASDYVDIFEGDGRYQLNIGATADHAIYQELGTSRHRAQPFIRPTLDMLAALVPQALAAEANARGGG
jgi:HK97 gp10 family phage protein